MAEQAQKTGGGDGGPPMGGDRRGGVPAGGGRTAVPPSRSKRAILSLLGWHIILPRDQDFYEHAKIIDRAADYFRDLTGMEHSSVYQYDRPTFADYIYKHVPAQIPELHGWDGTTNPEPLLPEREYHIRTVGHDPADDTHPFNRSRTGRSGTVSVRPQGRLTD